MIARRKKYSLWLVLGIAGTFFSISMSSCVATDEGGLNNGKDRTLEFSYMVKETREIKTRALDSIYISQTYNKPIYIELGTTVEGETVTQYGTYKVASGYEGKLDPMDGSEPLEWQTLNTPHTFYGWTVPWDSEYEPSADPVAVTFQNSSSSEGYYENYNNQIMEYLIGAQSDAYSYDTHGKYVDLTFFHLVSKIKIGTLQLTESSGAVQKNLKANVTFIGLPTEAILTPHPTTGRPVVTYDPNEVDFNNGVTYYIDNQATGSDVFYICPEVDFSTLHFQVELMDEAYKDYNIYYGTFDAVNFVRNPGTDYDDENSGDDTTLHAGEMMTLNINLIPGVGPGLALIIDPWSTEEPQESTYHSYPGIYSEAEMNEVLGAFLNQGNPNNGTTPEQIENLFEIYGKTIDGVNYFRMFDNVTNKGDATIPVPEGYMLDGQGHTIFLEKTHSGVFPDRDPYVNIGPSRDIYISNGTYTIYIDTDGNVWKLDPDTQTYQATGYSLEPLSGNYKSYDIDLVTGEVRQSTYYNNYITN
ncbi:MAG: hypothetical protein J1D77_01235 [Muribaculaceae bacterium]|nr:hypothetical protein [Muribaculaceae bacterium]